MFQDIAKQLGSSNKYVQFLYAIFTTLRQSWNIFCLRTVSRKSNFGQFWYSIAINWNSNSTYYILSKLKPEICSKVQEFVKSIHILNYYLLRRWIHESIFFFFFLKKLKSKLLLSKSHGGQYMSSIATHKNLKIQS